MASRLSPVDSLFSLNKIESLNPTVMMEAIIASRTGEALMKNEDWLRVIVISQGLPGRARNIGAKYSTASILFFLDDDAKVSREALESAIKKFEDPQVGAVGGPNITLEPASYWQRVSGLVLSSPLASASMGWRYRRAIEEPREVDETRLTSCNLLVRKDVFEKVGGFPEDFFPGEEIVLLHRIKKSGYKIIYDPCFVAAHRRRGFWGHIKSVFGYGYGRMLAISVDREIFKPLFAAPSLGLFVYLFSALYFPALVFLSLGYLCLITLESLRLSVRNGGVKYLPGLVLLIPLHHLAYALGFMWRVSSTSFRRRWRLCAGQS
jgi:cellulose synthase/poly-beta-1,6-N-acetylglucosamine synthase-like glycosyltransferase